LPLDFDEILGNKQTDVILKVYLIKKIFLTAKAKIGAEGIKSHVGTVFTVGHSGQLFGKSFT
jgi:hypothetical protein